MRSKKAILNIVVSLLLQFVTLICGFIVPKLIITKFGSNVNGLVLSITQFLGYITLLEAGFGPVVKAALYKPIAQKDSKEISNILKATEKFFRVIALIFVIYLIILSVLYPLITNTKFSFFYTMSLVLIISISTFAEYFFGMTYKLFLQAEQRTYITSSIQIVGYILNVIVIILLIKVNASIHIVKLISGLIFVLRPIVQNVYVKMKYNINLKDADSNYSLKQKWEGLAQHIAAVVHNNTDITILTIFAPIAEVSVYSVYALVVRGIKSIVQAFTGGIDASFGDMIAKGEKEQLNRSFKIYECFYHTITTISYVCTLLLIVPFIKVYTLGITDANYIRPLFGYLIVLAEFMWSVRLPYSSITLAAGHFKETRKGAWVETITNIVISLLLVWKFGIVGITIGTLVAMIIRTIEFMYHTNKYILQRGQICILKRMGVISVELFIVCILANILPTIEITSYISWILYAIVITICTTIVVITINVITYKEEAKQLIKIIQNNFLKRKVKSI